MKIDDLVKRVDELISHAKTTLASRYREGDHEFFIDYVNVASMAGLRSSSMSFLHRVFGAEHPHSREFAKRVDGHTLNDAEQALAMLLAVRQEIAGGWLFTFKGLVAAELFSDFIEMGEHLLNSGYKDPAAVMVGSVLEEHLRQLCHKNGIEVEDDKDGKYVPKKADRLNADLAKAGVYTKLDHKMVTAWLDLRNNAAHGKYDQYTEQQVKSLISGIVEFMTRVPI